MFSRIITSIRDQISKPHPDTTKGPSAQQKNSDVEDENGVHLTRSHSLQPTALEARRPSVTEAIGIQNVDSRGRRRSSTVFGISKVSVDDFMQKDLVSSSWS
ncbi:hypothetical protein J3Q64DRAFT_1715837 [Phycomyces blakesleeanus]|uniref:Uncharacterized protein n=2 Tax=Phycomyces blakesleeanus TaxID=4837 RepID=A0A167QIU3_PHYB8|nr:hypothetical protein PHYBLDRAFT_58807 [Phycomyces blakesleeanus NRRL 1555(-)]OAD79761.1 hypothetical protein PHYBLDRAFT_58807 [Phycomyces blakesleeanus NRRL 1555(-)]|eukprot:XP_018297801.1 hypothetical protein PHYBLDRAFT_58807 [Phycomyces blakesleeanus NRRL 1555(-)]